MASGRGSRTSGSAPTAAGARLPLDTVTANVCDALRPAGSLAVTRTVAAPTPTAVSVTRAPAASTVATSGADDDTEYVNASPSGSANAADTSTARVPGRVSAWSGRAPAAAGGRLAPAGRSRHRAAAWPVASSTAAASAGPVTPDAPAPWATPGGSPSWVWREFAKRNSHEQETWASPHWVG